MADFPALKTGAIAQYGSEKALRFATAVYRFIDQREQRFQLYSTGLRTWIVRLDLLDETEIMTLETFFIDQGGRSGSFQFEDPWTGIVYPNCRFGEDALALEYRGESRGKSTVTIVENRI